MPTRRERDALQMKDDILAAASQIAEQEGFEAISIRKIAQKIDYTPSLIYHYFASKEEIISVLLQRGYQKLTIALGTTMHAAKEPIAMLTGMTRTFLMTALTIPKEFVIVHLDSSAEVLEHTSYLSKGDMEKRLPLQFIGKCINAMHEGRVLDQDLVELTAQSIAAATLGLALKLITEKDLPLKQRETVITYFSDIVVARMARMED